MAEKTISSDPEFQNLNDNTGILVINRLPGISFKAVRWTLPGFAFEPVEQSVPNDTLYLPGAKFIKDPFVAEFVVDETMTNYLAIISWMFRLRFSDNPISLFDDYTLLLNDNQGRPSFSMRFTQGFPQGINQLDGTSRTDRAQPLTSTVTMRYQNIEIDTYDKRAEEYARFINTSVTGPRVSYDG